MQRLRFALLIFFIHVIFVASTAIAKESPRPMVRATLGYVFDAKQQHVLMIHRTRPSDPLFGKRNGLGGTLRRREKPMDGIRREVLEEAGIRPIDFRLRGKVDIEGLLAPQTRCKLYVFTARYEGSRLDAKQSCHEGTLAWIPVHDVQKLAMPEGDRIFVPRALFSEGYVFLGNLIYQNSQLVHSHFQDFPDR